MMVDSEVQNLIAPWVYVGQHRDFLEKVQKGMNEAREVLAVQATHDEHVCSETCLPYFRIVAIVLQGACGSLDFDPFVRHS